MDHEDNNVRKKFFIVYAAIAVCLWASVGYASSAEPDGNEYKTGSVSTESYDSCKGQQIIAMAKQYVGTPYVWGGASPDGFDCSGFVYYLYKQFGIDLPRMADGQASTGTPVNMNDLQPGDLVFFSTYEPGPSHSGIYLGDGYFIHASSGAGEVIITHLLKPYYKERYLGARRVIRQG